MLPDKFEPWNPWTNWSRGEATWKEGEVPTYTFEHLDTRDFLDTSFRMRAEYAFYLISEFLGGFSGSAIALPVDLALTITMFGNHAWLNVVSEGCDRNQRCIFVPFGISKWTFLTTPPLGLLAHAFKIWRSRNIVKTKNVTLVLMDPSAVYYHSLRSYHHFCFFSCVDRASIWWDNLVFFVYYAFQEFIPFILIHIPRQVVNSATVSTLLSLDKDTRNILEGPSYGPLTARMRVLTIMSSILFLLAQALPFLLSVGGYVMLRIKRRKIRDWSLREECSQRFNKDSRIE